MPAAGDKLRAWRRRALIAVAAALLLYVLAGELLQSWARLHMTAWQHGPVFGSVPRHAVEWRRVDAALATATRLWPWKSSLQVDVARVVLSGYAGGYLERADAGPEVLAAVARAKNGMTESGALLVLEIRGHLLAGDIEATEAAVQRLRQAAPHARPWWGSLLPLLCDFALGDSGLHPLARETLSWYAGSDRESFRKLARRYAAVQAFAPAQPTPVPR